MGIDVGTSDTKVLVTTVTGEEIGSVSASTTWRNHGGRYTDTDPSTLIAGIITLLAEAVRVTQLQIGPVRVEAIAATGMAEAGVLVDETGVPAHPIIAWFDPRGEVEIQQFPAAVLREFCGRTGLPINGLATISKLAWMRAQGTELRGRQWLNVPEFVVHSLGAVRASEMSLAARTGLLDQDSGELWPAALAAIGAGPELIPSLVVAGTPLGRVGDQRLPQELHGAVLTIAGHDHPVAAVGCGATGADEVFDSFGTAEALVRSVAGTLDMAARDRLAAAGVNAVHHVLAGRRLLLGGTKAGLILRRTLDLLGAGSGESRSALDDQACVLQQEIGLNTAPPGIRVWGAANNDGTLRVEVTTDALSPSAIWLAALSHGVDEAARCLDLMAAEIGPAVAVVVAGGWTRMSSVRHSKQASLPNVRFSDRSQAGAFGASMFAAHAAIVAREMAAAGDPSGNSLHFPNGPSEEFASYYTRPVSSRSAQSSFTTADPQWQSTGQVAQRTHQEVSR